MIFVLVPLRWRSGGAPPAPAVFRAADVFSYHYLPPELSAFMLIEPFVPAEPTAEAPLPELGEATPAFVLPAETSTFVLPPETSIFGVGLA